MLVVRPAGPADIEALHELAVLSGRGFTSLPENEKVLASRLELSAASFAGSIAPPEAWYTLMLEDGSTRRVEGVAGIRAAIGLKRPHFSFRTITLAQYSSAIGTRFDHQALVLVNECGGRTEVGSLFVRPEQRRGGAGRLLARARYMLIAAEPLRFSQIVMAELRGWFDEAGRSPFWDGVASKFFRLPFEEGDRLVTATDGQFLLDLAPRHPIYAELLTESAQAAIGQVNRDGMGALNLLEREGFERSGLIDIFDGGPTMTCARDGLATVRTGRSLRVAIGEHRETSSRLLSSSTIDGFRATMSAIAMENGQAILSAEVADGLRLRAGDLVRIAD